MIFKNIFGKALNIVFVFTLAITFVSGAFYTPKAEALRLGGLAGAVVKGVAEQEQVKKELDYFDNEGRHELFAYYKESEGVNTDKTMNAILDRIMQRLTTTIAKTEPSIKEKPYNYFVNNQTYFNAFCALGHNVSVNTGVFTFFDNNEDKIAAVVAHELVHGQREHPIKGAKKKLPVDLAKQIIKTQTDAAGRLAVDVVAVNVKNVGITKANEWEADNIAFQYMVDANYNPGAPAAVWQRVIDNTQAGRKKDVFSDILNPSTHPKETARRDNYSKKMTEYSKNKVVVDAKKAEIKVNDQSFMVLTDFANMTGAERSYLVAGNLAKVYAKGLENNPARNDKGVVKIGDQAIVQPGPNDKTADELVAILNAIK